MKSIAKVIARCTPLFAGFAAAVLVLTPQARATVGAGTLTVDHDTTACPGAFGFNDFDSPNHWDVHQGDVIHINLSPGFMICTSGTNLNQSCSSDAGCSTSKPNVCGSGNCTGPSGGKTCTNTGATCTSNTECANKCSSTSLANAGASCTSDADCNIQGTCASALECSGDTTVEIKGKDGNGCTSDADCTLGCDTGDGLCKTVQVINTSGRTGNGAIDVCYTVRSDACSTAQVAYCNNQCGQNNNASCESNVQLSHNNTVTFVAADLRTVGDAGTGTGLDGDGDNDNDVPLNTVGQCAQELVPPDCTNQVGSLCCGLTQGAYGAPNSIATKTPSGSCSSPNCSATGLGFLPAASCLGCDAFTQTNEINATTIGNESTNSVTIADLCTLNNWLPAGGTPKALTSGDHDYPPIPSSDRTSGGTASKGSGGGALSGQTMGAELNTFLSSCSTPWGGGSFTTSGFGGFTLPGAGTLVCTKRAGNDNVVGTADDICQAFSYPSCVAGKTVDQVVACANECLASGSNPCSNSCGCSAGDLTNALNNINYEFDGCGNVIDCGSITTAGLFACVDPPHSASCGSQPGDAAAVATVRSDADGTCAGAANHGAYISCVSHFANAAASGPSPFLPKVCKGQVLKCAAQSTSGTDRVTCCRTSSKGVTKCSIKSSADRCTAPLGGSACVGTHASCCDACDTTNGGCS
jgi:hypothetical protein